MAQDFSVGVVCEDARADIELTAQLQLLGEQVTEVDTADALFAVIESAAELAKLNDQRPKVICGPATVLTGLNEADIARSSTVVSVSMPVQRAELEDAIAQLYAVAHSQRSKGHEILPEIIGSSDCLTNLKHKIGQVAAGDSTVLLTGPSGTGKSFLAETIHRHSDRSAGPFVPINCGAIPSELIESELFGHEKGAFTGALERRAGRFELAAGGTLFLDEIGDMPFGMQVKLLRAIQERAYERVGGMKTLTADVRLIAATNVDLEARIAAGTFREDLYYRINVFPIAVPSLSERAGDLPELISYFQTELQAQYGYAIRLSTAAIAALQRYSWPGNLRELRNLLERLTVEHAGALLAADALPRRYRGAVSTDPEPLPLSPETAALLPINGIDLKAHLAELEQTLIEQALRDSDAVVARAADRLHIRRTTLVEKMRKYGIDRATH
ncbi:MAG: sigma-54 interaction domain-containing protein [Pseudomonadales bacterium]